MPIKQKNDPELFQKFGADMCIEINIEALLETLRWIFSHQLKGATVDAREVVYFDPKLPIPTVDQKDLVFLKQKIFSNEAEFRVAIFYPSNKSGFRSTEKIVIPFQMEDDSLHITFSHSDENLIKRFIVGAYELESSQSGIRP